MQNLKVEWIEEATAKTGRPYKKLAIVDEKGQKYNVNIFSNFLDFANITLGSTIVGNLVKEGNYWNIVTEAYQAPKRSYEAYKAPQTASIAKAMEKKEASIEKFVDRKEDNMKLMAAQRDAVLIVTTFDKNAQVSVQEIKEEIIKWRNWFLLSPDFNEIPPFE